MDFTLIINTVKGFLTKPTEEWQKIKGLAIDKKEMLTKLVVPLIVVYVVATLLGQIIKLLITPYVAQFLGFGRIFAMALVNSVLMGAVMFGIIYGGAFVIYALADNFGARKDDTASFKVMVFSYMVALVASVAQIIPYLGALVYAAGGIYSLVLLFWGMRDVLDTPKDKIVLYFILILVIIIAAAAVLAVIVGFVTGFIIGGALMRY